MAIIRGTAARDDLLGTNAADTILAFAGNDRSQDISIRDFLDSDRTARSTTPTRMFASRDATSCSTSTP